MKSYGNYFTFDELTTTDTGFCNHPDNPFALQNLGMLWNWLNMVREALGAPIYVNSAFRTAAVNYAVNGADKSYHMQGRAADIRTIPEKMTELWNLLEDDDTIELLNYGTFYHVAI